MKKSWISEIQRTLAVLIPSVLIGILVERPYELAALGLAVVVGYHLYQVARLLRWIGSGDIRSRPRAGGIWSVVYARVGNLLKNNEDRRLKLTAMLAQFQRTAEAIPDAVVALGPLYEIRWLNEAAGTLLGLRPHQDTGQPIQNLLRSPEFQSYLNSAVFDGKVEIKAPRDDQIRLSVRIVPYGEDQYLLMAQDVTERHLLERVRKDFVANVSHELRTPLTVIGGFVENMRHDESGFAEKWQRALNLMGQQSGRMQGIVEDLLLLTSLESAPRQKAGEIVVLSEVLEEIVEEAKAILPDGENREISIDVAAANLLGNPLQLRSAFTNLVTNAVKYTPSGGSIDVRWIVSERGGILEVTDTGEGIAKEHLPRLTERFYRVDAGRSREKGGTGLGLAIAKHVLQQHNAHLEIESVLGEGSCFRCVFPPEQLVSEADVPRIADAR